MSSRNRAEQVQHIERDAEALTVYHLDLLAQLEQQLRAVHHTMRHIEKLRTAKYRVGPELTNGQREGTLADLDAEVATLVKQLGVENECCADMRDLIGKMQQTATKLHSRVLNMSR